MSLKRVVLEQAVRIAKQDKQIAKLKAQLKEALEKIEKYEKNSSTSSKPPSSDIVKAPKPKPQGKRKRKIGAQPGHKAHQRQPFTSDQIDLTVEVKLDACPKCNGKLVVTEQSPKIYQQIELVDRCYIITEYFCLYSHCEHCQRTFVAKRPPEMKSGLFGANLIATTAYMKSRDHMSYTTLRDHFRNLYGICVSTGFLAKQIRKVSDALEKPYEELSTQLPKEEHLHIDETGHKENGKLGWTWCFRAPKFTLFHINKSRGSVVLEKFLGKDYAGIISCDYHGAYRKFARKSKARLQHCFAHLIREVKYLVKRKVRKVSNYGKRLLSAIEKMFSTIHREDEYKLKENWIRRMYCHREEVLKIAWHRLPDDNDAINIAVRLWNKQEDYFRFIDRGLQPTNNLAEQSIRRVVIDRKITQGTRSDWGNRWQERIWSVLSTCAQSGTNVLTFLRDAVAALLGGTTTPKILK
jgi:transposase